MSTCRRPPESGRCRHAHAVQVGCVPESCRQISLKGQGGLCCRPVAHAYPCIHAHSCTSCHMPCLHTQTNALHQDTFAIQSITVLTLTPCLASYTRGLQGLPAADAQPARCPACPLRPAWRQATFAIQSLPCFLHRALLLAPEDCKED